MTRKFSCVFLGPPGSGKGTQTYLLGKSIAVPIISTGNMLRQEIEKSTTIGEKIQGIIQSGQLVDDDIVLNILRLNIKKREYEQGYILDGIPRTLTQAEKIYNLNIAIKIVVELTLSDSIVLERLTGRYIHIASGRTYHMKFNPPKYMKFDDITGEKLVRREDDSPRVIRQRLKLYHENIHALQKFYHTTHIQYLKVCAKSTKEEIHQKILRSIR